MDSWNDQDDWAEQEAMIGEHLAKDEPIVDLDPHRTVTFLDNGVPHCYLGHPECYDSHISARLADEADWSSES